MICFKLADTQDSIFVFQIYSADGVPCCGRKIIPIILQITSSCPLKSLNHSESFENNILLEPVLRGRGRG